jgi:hypothetical protein
MKVHSLVYDAGIDRSFEATVDEFTVEMPDGTQYRIKEDTSHAITVLRIGAGARSMLPLTITPVVSNKVILS